MLSTLLELAEADTSLLEDTAVGCSATFWDLLLANRFWRLARDESRLSELRLELVESVASEAFDFLDGILH